MAETRSLEEPILSDAASIFQDKLDSEERIRGAVNRNRSLCSIIFIVNPTSSQYPALTVLAQNAALPSVTGAYFLLNSANPQITTQALPLTLSGNGYAATIAVPAYSTAAISIATHFAYLPLILR